MPHDEREDTTIYQVIVNDEEQYSIWPADRELPLGWKSVGKVGTKQECLDYIKEVWTDMRPLSLRKKMEEMEAEMGRERQREQPTLRNARAMRSSEREDRTIYQVMVNHEEQYSIWPADRELPLGWNSVGKTGTREECLAYIEEVWTDMRPLSLRKKMEEMARGNG